MDLIKQTLEVIGVYKKAVIAKSETTVATSKMQDYIKTSGEKLRELEAKLKAGVQDAESKNAAEKQRAIFEALSTWGNAFAVGDYGNVYTEYLNDALNLADEWHDIRLGFRIKPANESEVYGKDKISPAVLALSKSGDYIQRIDSVIDLLDNYNRQADLAENADVVEEFRERIEALRANIAENENSQSRIVNDYNLGNISEEEADDMLVELQEDADLWKSELEEYKEMNSDIKARYRTLRGQTKPIMMPLRKLKASNLQSPEYLEFIANNLNFEAINNYLNGASDAANINEVLNIQLIDSEIQAMKDKAMAEAQQKRQQIEDAHKPKITEEQKPKLRGLDRFKQEHGGARIDNTKVLNEDAKNNVENTNKTRIDDLTDLDN